MNRNYNRKLVNLKPSNHPKAGSCFYQIINLGAQKRKITIQQGHDGADCGCQFWSLVAIELLVKISSR